MSFIQNIDNAVTSFIFNNWHGNNIVNQILGVFTRLGSGGIFWILFFSFIFIYHGLKEKRISMFAIGGIITLALGFVLNDFVLKKLYYNLLSFRDRPCQIGAGEVTADQIQAWLTNTGLEIKTGGSFPSGHSFSSFNCAVYIMFYNKKLGWITLPVALAIAFSRVFIGVHFMFDVIVGALFGILFGIGMYYLTNFICKKLHVGEEGKSFYAIR